MYAQVLVWKSDGIFVELFLSSHLIMLGFQEMNLGL